MKNKIIIIILFSFFIGNSQSKRDTISDLNNQIEYLKNKVSQVESNQLNYKIEKDLLKETYSNNYEKINMVITIILGIIALLGYLGIKDINSTRKQYASELETLKGIQLEFENKSKEFDLEKIKLDDEIKQIFKENDTQNKKIKFIELKEKISLLIKDRRLYDALEFVNAALGIEPNNDWVLRQKARIYVRLNQLSESIKIYDKLVELYPENSSIALDAIECMYFANKIKETKNISKRNSDALQEKEDGKLITFLNFIKSYHEKDEESMTSIIKTFIDFENLQKNGEKFKSWDLEEAKFFAAHEPISELQKQLQYGIWYLNGQVSGQQVCDIFKIKNA